MTRQIQITSGLILLLIVLFSCANTEKVKLVEQQSKYIETESGLKYALHINDAQQKAKIGDVLELHLTAFADTLELHNTYKEGKPKHLLLTNPSFKGSYEEGLKMMGAGDSATFICSADKVFKYVYGDEIPTRLAKGSEMIYHVKILKLRNEEEEIAARKSMLEGNVETLPSGMIRKTFFSGTGEKLKLGDKVQLEYKLQKLGGDLVNSSQNGSAPLEFVLGEGKVIRGLEEAVAGQFVGARMQVIIPSYLAYNERPYLNLDPYSPLECFIEILKIDNE